jgi:hypothetical protein
MNRMELDWPAESLVRKMNAHFSTFHRSAGIFRFLPSRKLVSQTSQLGEQPPCPQLKKALIRNEVANHTA